MTVDGIVKQNGYNLIVRLIPVDHAETTNRPCFHKDVTMCDLLFRKHTNIYRITITFNVLLSGFFHAEFSGTL